MDNTPITKPPFGFRTITQREFNLYSGNWQVVVNSLPDKKGGDLLRQCFVVNDGGSSSITNYVGYSAPSIVQLVATPGAARIEARFVCQNLTEGGFAVVLYAADRQGNRISAYYLSDGTEKTPKPADTPLDRVMSGSSDQGAIQVPHYIVVEWLGYWKSIWNWELGGTGPQRDMFINPYGTLQGYSYSVGDLSQSLFYSQPVSGIDFYLLFNFCLHEYQNLAGETHYTFGMVIRLYNNGKKPTTGTESLATGTENLADDDDSPSTTAFYDMSYPRPPYGTEAS